MRDLTAECLEGCRIAMYRLGNALAWELNLLTAGEDGITEQAAYRSLMGMTGLAIAEIKDIVAAVAYYGEEYAGATDPRAVGYIARKIDDDEQREAMIARAIEDEWTYERAKSAVRDYKPPRSKSRPARHVAENAWQDLRLECGGDFEELDELDARARVGVARDFKVLHGYFS